MHHFKLAYIGNDELTNSLLIYCLVVVVIFFIGLYIFRAIFNIPSFLRYQRAQIRLLEEMAKTQGVDSKKVQSIISESRGWDAEFSPNSPSNTSA